MDKIDSFVAVQQPDQQFTPEEVAAETYMDQNHASRLLALQAKNGQVNMIGVETYTATQAQIAVAARRHALSGSYQFAVGPNSPSASNTSSARSSMRRR